MVKTTINSYDIPTFRKDAEKCSEWVTAYSRDKFSVNDVDGSKYVSWKHFVGGNTDNEDFPDPYGPIRLHARGRSSVPSAAFTCVSRDIPLDVGR